MYLDESTANDAFNPLTTGISYFREQQRFTLQAGSARRT